MTGGDDDIAASLPRPPGPAPARREAAIREALRRFDGEPARPAPVRERRPPPIWLRPHFGALAGAFLVALIGLPFVWTAFDDYSGKESGGRPPPVAATGPATADPAPAPAPAKPGPAAEAAPPAQDRIEAPGPVAAEPAGPPPRPAQAQDGPAAARNEAAAEEAARAESGDITVTGSRIRNPNLESAVPVTTVSGAEVGLSARRAKAARRGDWNACTIDDPGESLERCRGALGTVARGARGRASEPLADGLAKGWSGDMEAAIGAFDRAIELSPRSSSAWLNRALARQRRGELDKALADLDQAVRLAPGDARAYYHRSLVLRERGDLRRARADEARAAELDPRYAPLVRNR